MSVLTRLLNRIRFGKPVVVVSGLPRSGTSMVMQMLHAGGLTCATDDERGADEDNPRGYFELQRVKQLDKGADKAWLGEHRGQAIKVISFLLRDLPLNVNYRVLFITRNMDEILASQKKMLSHRGRDAEAEDDGAMAHSFKKHLDQVDGYLKHSSNFETLYFDHAEALSNAAGIAGLINDFLGGGLDEAAMAATVDGSLHRHRVQGVK